MGVGGVMSLIVDRGSWIEDSEFDLGKPKIAEDDRPASVDQRSTTNDQRHPSGPILALAEGGWG
jgi:hypothetical protein